MIGTKLYQKKSRVYLFLALYGVLALIGVALIVQALSHDRNPSGAEGFTLMFGAGMSILTWIKSRRPRVVIGSERLELYQQNRPQYIAYKSISTVTRTRDRRLVIAVRDGHELRNHSVWLRELENADADQLADFCLGKRWRSAGRRDDQVSKQ